MLNLGLVSHAVLWLNCSVGACSHKSNFRHGTIRRTPCQRATQVASGLHGSHRSALVCRELAHGQTYSSEDVYGERRANEQLCCEWAAWLRCSVGHNWLLLTLPLLSSMYFGSIQNNFTTRPTYPTFFGYGHLFFTARPKKL